VRNATGDGYMICLSDMVVITSEEYSQLKKEFLQRLHEDEKCICLPRYKNEKGNPVIFSSSCREEILRHQEMEGCKAIVQQNKEHIHWIEMNSPHVLQDMDHREDYELLNQ
jgi:molybdenum cofactor cytidylyltransferase